ncbi:MAG: BtrH N-terminal domain-containing protein [Thermoproteota archaeon]
MRKLVEGFVHRPGHHSPTSAMRDILEFNDFKLSEEMVFGLDCGLGFMYWRSKEMSPPILIGGASNEGIVEACRILGIKVEIEKTESEELAWKGVKKMIDSNFPVVLRVDLNFLDYVKAPMDLHFGKHTIVATGYDEEKGLAFVWDNRLEELQTISLISLSKARGSKFKPFPPDNAWYRFDFPKSLTKLEGAIKMAVRENSETFLDPTIKNSGLRGIRYFAEQLDSWPSNLSPSELVITLKVNNLFIEGFGDGTGLFRRIYSRFLKEAHALLGDEELDESGTLLEKSAEIWTKVGELFLKASDADLKEIPQYLSESKEKVLECYDLEKQTFELLKTLSDRWLEQFVS